MSVDLLWFTGRGTGLIALALLTLVVVLGILGRSGRAALGLTRFAVADVHRNASLIALGLVFVHLIVLWMDPYAQLTVFDLVIPFDAVYRPFWVGLGTIGMELLVLLVVTSLLRQRLGARAWKLVHWAAYAMWPIAWLHGWFSGTDAGKGWFLLVTIGSLLAVAGATAWRLSPAFLEFSRPKPAPLEPGTPTAQPTNEAPPLTPRDGSAAAGGRHHRAAPLRQPTGGHPTVPRRSRPEVRALREPTGSQRPVSGPFREPTGAYRTLTPFDQTGSQPRIPDHTGSTPRLADHTGSQPRFPEHTGSVPRVSDQTGSQPRVQGHTGFTPRIGDHTGSQPRVPPGDPRPFGDPRLPGPGPRLSDHTGSQPRLSDHTGSQPRIGDQTGSQPRITDPGPARPANELPAFNHEDWFR